MGTNPTTSTTFIGPTVVVTVSANQYVFVTADKALGSTAAAGATLLNLRICYQSTGGGAFNLIGGGAFGLRVPTNTRLTFGLNADFLIATAGSYNVGLCGSSSDAANWNNNEWGYVSAFIHE